MSTFFSLLAQLVDPPFIFFIFSSSLFQSLPLSLLVITPVSVLHTSSGECPVYSPLCSSIGLFEQSPSPGSSVPADSQKVSGGIQNHSVIQVMSRVSKQRFQAEGGFPVCRQSSSPEDGVEHLQLRGSSDAVGISALLVQYSPVLLGKSLECSWATSA